MFNADHATFSLVKPKSKLLSLQRTKNWQNEAHNEFLRTLTNLYKLSSISTNCHYCLQTDTPVTLKPTKILSYKIINSEINNFCKLVNCASIYKIQYIKHKQKVFKLKTHYCDIFSAAIIFYALLKNSRHHWFSDKIKTISLKKLK